MNKIAVEAFYKSDELSVATKNYSDRLFDEVFPFDPAGLVNRGIDKLRAGFTKEALKDFNEALRLYPEFAAGYYFRGLSYSELDSLRKAKSDFHLAIDLDPLLVEACNELGRIYFDENKIDSARQVLQHGIDFYPAYGLTYFNMGVLEMYADHGAKAVKMFQEAIDRDSCFINAHLGLSLVYLERENFKQTISNLENAIKCDGTSAVFILLKGFLQKLRGNKKQALADFNEAISIAPEVAFFYLIRSLHYIYLRKYHEAVEDLLTVHSLNLDKKSIKQKEANLLLDNYTTALKYFGSQRFSFNSKEVALLEEGICMLIINENSIAEKNFKKILDKSKESCALCYYLTGLADENRYRNKSAIQKYDATLETDPSLYKVYEHRADLKIKTKITDYDGAIADYSEVLKREPENVQLQKKRGELHMRMENYNLAILDFNIYLEQDSLNLDVLYNRATCYEVIKLYENAIADYTKILKEKSYDLGTRYRRAACYYLSGNKEKAFAECDSIVTHNKFYLEAFNLMGAICLEKEDFKKAVFYFNKALKNNQHYKEAYFNRYLAYVGLQYYEYALKDLNALIEIDETAGLYYYYRAQLKHLLTEKSACKDMEKSIELGIKVSAEEIAKICP
ncbi:MAG: hypothetical protein DHS20C18_04430 [Saprospiraceae bacterium]|nr:MAG: hypothetical protein DHS20C18_04430 [Saprospiraceae bacterium]